MKTKMFLSLLIGLLAVGVSKAQITVYCGEEGTASFQMAKDMEANLKTKITVQPTEKLVESVRNLKAGEVCFMQYDILQQEKLNDFKNGTQYSDNVQLLLPLGTEELHLLVLQDNPIRDFKDLVSGKKVAVGKSGQAMRMTIEVIKSLTQGQWEDQELSFRDAVKALLNKEIDAMFFVGSAPAKSLSNFAQLAGAKTLLRLIPITDKRLAESYNPATIRPSTYQWADYQIETFAARSVLVAKLTTDDNNKDTQQLKAFLSELRTVMPKIQKSPTAHPNWRRVNYNFDGLNWPIHPAAQQTFMPAKGATDDAKKGGAADAKKGDEAKKGAATDDAKKGGTAKDPAKKQK